MVVQAELYYDHNMGFSNLPQDWVGSSSVFGIGDESFSYLNQQQQDLRFLDSQKIMNLDYCNHNLNLVSSSNSRRNGIIGFEKLSSELEKQRLEMDCFLHFQNEKLKAVLTEESRKRELILMFNYETKMKSLMEAKDEAITTATNRTTELENYLKMAEKESKIWEKKAIENEAIVTELTKKINQVKSRKYEDAESVYNGGFDHDENERKKRTVCKICHVRTSCVLLLPCRHLCCCRNCEEIPMFCPVCETVKNGSLEVFFNEG